MAGPQAYDKLVEYMHHVKKPTTMAPSTLVDHAQTLFCYTNYLSMDENTAGPEIPMAQQWRLMLTMFPEPWVRNFTNSGLNPSTVTVAAMLAYMNDQLSAEVINNECKCGFDGGQHGNIQCMHSGQNNNYYHHNRRGGRGCGGNNNNNNNNNNSRNSYQHGGRGGHGNGCGNGHSLPPIQPDDECQIHGGHK
jgi:hypothetical protein